MVNYIESGEVGFPLALLVVMVLEVFRYFECLTAFDGDEVAIHIRSLGH